VREVAEYEGFGSWRTWRVRKVVEYEGFGSWRTWRVRKVVEPNRGKRKETRDERRETRDESGIFCTLSWFLFPHASLLTSLHALRWVP
jgi:hypothetical protein